MRTAGAGDRFRYSTQHSVYIYQGIRDFVQKRQAAGYWTVRLNAATPKVGDLVCWAREDGVDYDHQKGGDYKGHTDLVVEVGADQVLVVGGNVGTRSPSVRSGSTPRASFCLLLKEERRCSASCNVDCDLDRADEQTCPCRKRRPSGSNRPR